MSDDGIPVTFRDFTWAIIKTSALNESSQSFDIGEIHTQLMAAYIHDVALMWYLQLSNL